MGQLTPMATKAKKTGFARLSKSEHARVSAMGGKATTKKLKAAKKSILTKERKTALKAVLNKHLKEKAAAAKPAQRAAKQK
jgi:hypothetical protein